MAQFHSQAMNNTPVTAPKWIWHTKLPSAFPSSKMEALESLMVGLALLFFILVPLAFLLVCIAPNLGAEQHLPRANSDSHLRGGAFTEPEDTSIEEFPEKGLHRMTEAPLFVPASNVGDEPSTAANVKNRKRRISSHTDNTLRQRRGIPATFDDTDGELRYRSDTDEEVPDEDVYYTPVDRAPESKHISEPVPTRKEAIDSTIMPKRFQQGTEGLPSTPIPLAKQSSFPRDTDDGIMLPQPASPSTPSSAEYEPPRSRARPSNINAHIDAMMRQQYLERMNQEVADVPFGSQQSSHGGYGHSDSKSREIVVTEASCSTDAAPAAAAKDNALPQAQAQAHNIESSDETVARADPPSHTRSRRRRSVTSLHSQAHGQSPSSPQATARRAQPAVLHLKSRSAPSSTSSQSRCQSGTGLREAGWWQSSRLLFAEDPAFSKPDPESANIRRQIKERRERFAQAAETGIDLACPLHGRRAYIGSDDLDE